jgi:hypothetical protein
LRRYYRRLEELFWPDLIVVGGGVSKKADKFLPLLELRTEIVPAQLRNQAGIVGAAMLAHQRARDTSRASARNTSRVSAREASRASARDTSRASARDTSRAAGRGATLETTRQSLPEGAS